ncbi:CapA family protein [Pseudoalteromonas sp. MMG010]|uniref:CapA family protein n=1 Tax=Pseudoalteromonas sp. MMG010 TaxID=2822685 RepID=UPI001B3A355A|nr:CapA family protein [Pseudoalteromonas sp. MMG010]MBQ4833085.1 CapA family protein [Pseudoalteromonas sp. MMG010]
MNCKNVVIFVLAYSLIGCNVEDSTVVSETESQKTNAQLKSELIATSYSGTITINNESLQPVSGVSIQLADQQFTTNENGVVNLSDISYGNHSVFIESSSYLPYTSTLLINDNAFAYNLTIQSKSSTQSSLLFAGDTMFGRRFLDPSLTTMTTDIPDVEDALIRPATASEDAQALTHYVSSFFQAADFASVNLESPITDTPQTLHPSKEFSFFSLSDTLNGIKSIGVDYIALGNNHVYDFLEDGLEDTLLEVEQADLAYSGAGVDIASAYQPEYIDVGTLKLGLFSATSITGIEHEITYVTGENKGGAADLTETALVDASLEQAKQSSDFVIAQMHGGNEYSYAPTSYIEGRFEALSQQNTDLLIAHHPHIAQGFAVYNNVPAILGLGNFVFDQNRLETLLGVAVMTTVDADTKSIANTYAYPIYIEEYQPRFTRGFLSDYLLRRLAELSDDNITLIPKEGYAKVYFEKNKATVSTNSVEITLQSDQTLVDLRNYAPTSKAFLSKVELIEGTIPSNIKLGRDMMIFGDFEDWDNDNEQLEVARWDHSADSIALCVSDVRTGEQALCSTRTQFSNQPSFISFKQTIRTMELQDDAGNDEVFKDFSLLGYSKADNAGKLDAEIVYTTAEDNLEFSTQYVDIENAGTHDWQAFQHDFSLPSDETTLGPDSLPPRGIKLAFRHFSPESSEGTLMLDDIAMISWQQPISLTNEQWQTEKMHGFDFMHLQSDSTVKLRLTFSTLN